MHRALGGLVLELYCMVQGSQGLLEEGHGDLEAWTRSLKAWSRGLGLTLPEQLVWVLG